MLASYLEFVTTHPFLAAFIQFSLLGTLGEILATIVRLRTFQLNLGKLRVFLKLCGWGALGIYIKLMFLLAAGGEVLFVPLLGDASAWFQTDLGRALFTSVLMNLMLGPSMMIFHRLCDNLIDRIAGVPSAGWQGIEKSIATLVWLWIPLHTYTFMQPKEIRVGVAAALSLVLGVVMGYFSRK